MTQITNKMIAAAWAKWKPRHKDRLGPGPAFVEALQAAMDLVPSRSFHVGPIGPGEVTGPVYVNHIPYVPASEVKRLRAALEWYGEQAEATARHTIVINPKALEAIVTVLSLDAGGRARAALGQESTT